MKQNGNQSQERKNDGLPTISKEQAAPDVLRVVGI